MKKVLTGLFTLVLTLCFSCIANACDIEGLYANYQAVYMPKTKTWATAGMADGRVVLTKKTTEGSGNYSEYYYGNGKLAVALKSNFEFIKDGQLIGVDNAGLKYYKISYNTKSKKFVETPLSEKELQKLFPNAKIVKISQFTNNEYTLNKPFFKERTILLLNDTDKYFHKYTYTPSSVQTTDIKGLITVKHIGKVKFSLYGDKTNMLTIKVKDKKACCKCGVDCTCAPKCNCKNECKCGKDCNCGPKCDCSKDCNCDPKCDCAPKCDCKK